MQTFATMREQANKRWLVSLDGFANDFRVLWIPLTGSLLVQQRSPIRDWLTVSGFKQWAHFVQIGTNLSDVPEVLRWLDAHDEEARAIADRGRRFMQERADFDGAVRYLFRILEAF